MRRNIFLHFLNRDTREIYRLYKMLDRAGHARALRVPLNAAAMLCEDFCVAPPGFVIEDELAFELFEAQSAYLASGLVRLPVRERSLADYAEKKRDEYAPMRNRYSGLFDDSRMNYLSSHDAAIIRRKVHIGPAIVDGFQGGVDTKQAAWKRIRDHASKDVIQNLRETPARLAEDGKALTWSMIQPSLIEEGKGLHAEMRDALQYVYFREYCIEFRLIALADAPYVSDVFYLPVERGVYSVRRLRLFLSALHASRMFLEASASTICRFRSLPGFIELMDAYGQMAEKYPGDQNLQYHTSLAVRRASFNWNALSLRQVGSFNDLTQIEIFEIADGCAEVARILTNEHGLKVRVATRTIPARNVQTIVRGKSVKITIFVALEMELEVLVKSLGLKRLAGRVAAQGRLEAVEIDVLCPRSMGRVPAAVEVSRYLSDEKAKPNMILCVGLAGGFKEEKVEQGMVICANVVVDLANRKVTDDLGGVQSKFRRQDFDCSRAIYEVAMSEVDRNAWEAACRDDFDWPKGRTPSLVEGKIASVDEVLSSDEHRKKMVESVDKLLGVEMEAGGVCAAAKTFKIPVAVLRVVSDMADPSKADDAWRSRGMKTLADLLKRLPFEKIMEVENA